MRIDVEGGGGAKITELRESDFSGQSAGCDLPIPWRGEFGRIVGEENLIVREKLE